MSLYDLVSLKKSLKENLKVEDSIIELTKLKNNLENIFVQVPNIEDHNNEYINNLINHYTDIISKIKLPADNLKEKINQIDEEIYAITQKLFANNYTLEQNPIEGAEFIRKNRRIFVHEDIEKLIRQKILLYTDWRYPSLEIGCRDGEWTQYMVAADPLYIIDRYSEFLDSTASIFSIEYQRRLRKYELKNDDLSVLPINQFGFIFSWSYFNYISIDTIKIYLRQIYDLLKPGGVVLFSYNDGDTPSGASMAEIFSQTYVPKSLLVLICEGLGFDVTDAPAESTNTSWIELKKPGKLTTVKAHQVLGEIKRIGF